MIFATQLGNTTAEYLIYIYINIYIPLYIPTKRRSCHPTLTLTLSARVQLNYNIQNLSITSVLYSRSSPLENYTVLIYIIILYSYPTTVLPFRCRGQY